MSDIEEMGEILTRTGGSAFPATYALPSGGTFDGPGMTLRDWFAGQALAALISKTPLVSSGSPRNSGVPEGEKVTTEAQSELKRAIAQAAYSYADAMLAERAK